VLRDLAGKEAMLSKKFGVAIFSDKEKKNVRSMRDIMTDIAKATGGAIGGKKGLNKIFSAESMGVAAGFLKSLEQSKSGGGILFKLDMGSSADIESQYKTRMDGVAKEAQQVKIALAQLENGITRHGMSLVSWIGNNTTQAGTIAGGFMTAFLLKGGMQAALAESVKGLTGFSSTLAKTAGPLAGAAALGVALGTLGDSIFGFSDWISNKILKYVDPEAFKKYTKSRREAGVASIDSALSLMKDEQSRKDAKKKRAALLAAPGPTAAKLAESSGKPVIPEQSTYFAVTIKDKTTFGIKQESSRGKKQ